VWVFAPLDEDRSWLGRLGLASSTWNPLEAASSSGAAAELADHFTAEGKRGHNAHWYFAASSLISGLAICERERGGDMRSVVARLNRTAPSEYVGLARTVKDGTAAELLLAYALTPEREAGSIASTARSSLSLWTDERVAIATRLAPEAVDLDRLLAEAGTLYLVAPAEDAERCRPLFSALLMSLLRRATAKARAQGGSPATPPVAPARESNSSFATTISPRSRPATAPKKRERSGTTAALGCCFLAKATSGPSKSSRARSVTRRACTARVNRIRAPQARPNSARASHWLRSMSCGA
jgi:hypothetical protein